MARAAARHRRRQADNSQPALSSTFARVSKTTVVAKSEKGKSIALKKLAFEKLEQEQPAPRSTTPPTTVKTKRKRVESESEDETESIQPNVKLLKKSRVQLPTPPRSTPERATPETVVPAAVSELIEIHKAFMKAFSIHRAHNGASAPAELGLLLDSVTRLYRKRVVGVADMQRMLGLFEILTELGPRSAVQHTKSPFKLVISGLGTARRSLVEFVGYETQSRKNGRIVTQRISDFNDQVLQALFESNVDRVCSYKQLSGSVEAFPLLEFSAGAQTIAKQNKASEMRRLILDGRKPDLDFGKLSVRDDNEAEPVKAQTVKSRTLSLFDRVKAKQTANAAVKAPSPDDLRRKHAIGRVAEIVEILRMKQQQKQRSLAMGRKVSFSLQQIVSEIEASLSIPMGSDAVALCVEILAREVQDGWCAVFELGQTKSVVLTGTGKSGAEIAVLLKDG